MKENNRVYLICIIFFISAFLILEFNLSEQGIFIDEVFHHTFGLLWYDYVVANDFQNSCITGLTNCDMPVMKCDGVHLSVATGGLVKGIFTVIKSSYQYHFLIFFLKVFQDSKYPNYHNSYASFQQILYYLLLVCLACLF